MVDNKKKGILIAIFSAIIIIIAGTFAWLSWRTQSTAMFLTVGSVDGLQVTLSPYQINATLSPVSSYSDGIVIDVTAQNKKNEADNFVLYYKIDAIAAELIDSGFKYTITKCTANCNTPSNYTVLTSANGDFSQAASNSNLNIYQETLAANTTYKYKVYLWIDSSSGNQSNMQNKSFKGELRATISFGPYSVMRDAAVMDNISSTYVTSSTGINWYAASSNTNGKGIYIRSGTENDTYPIYYYRGAVTDNNVIFAGFCWKMVRTTNTGGTKLIYNGIPTGTNHDQCNNTGTASQLASTSKYANNYDSPADVGYMYGTRYTTASQAMKSITDTYMYGTGYDESSHRLVSTNAMNFAGTSWGTYYNQLSNNHYTCFNTSGECNQVYYIYTTNNTTAYYIQIPNGKTISGMLDEMLTNSSNANPSTIKAAIDTWYAANMISYTSYLEDTQYCNDRSIYDLAGWSPTGSTTPNLYFGAYGRTLIPNTPSLTCNTNDAFTVSQSIGNGKLTYPIGLLTSDEMSFAGGVRGNAANTTYYLYTGQDWWSSTASGIGNGSINVYAVSSNGALIGAIVDNVAKGVRPVVSLKSGTVFSGGSGTVTNPYIVN